MRTVIAMTCLLLASSVCQAESIYRWTGADGRIVFGDLPPSSAANVTRVKSGIARPKSPEAPVQVQPPSSELASREDDCARKREQVENYRNATKLVERDNLGREKEFSEEERELLIARTEAEINVLCQ